MENESGLKSEPSIFPIAGTGALWPLKLSEGGVAV